MLHNKGFHENIFDVFRKSVLLVLTLFETVVHRFTIELAVLYEKYSQNSIFYRAILLLQRTSCQRFYMFECVCSFFEVGA